MCRVEVWHQNRDTLSSVISHLNGHSDKKIGEVLIRLDELDSKHDGELLDGRVAVRDTFYVHGRSGSAQDPRGSVTLALKWCRFAGSR